MSSAFLLNLHLTHIHLDSMKKRCTAPLEFYLLLLIYPNNLELQVGASE
ncbi:hypothetical protein VIOR103205_09400 [Vibrio ordalii]|jgi:hypothetical protein